MNKYLLLLLTLLTDKVVAGDDKIKPDEKLTPLSEEFLLFLAEMEDVNGDLVHPVDLTKNVTLLDNKQNSKQSPDKINVQGKNKDVNKPVVKKVNKPATKQNNSEQEDGN